MRKRMEADKRPRGRCKAPTSRERAAETENELRRARLDLEKSLRRFELLAHSEQELLRTTSPQTILNDLCRKVMQHLDCHVFFNYLKDEANGRLRLNAWEGIAADAAQGIEWLDIGAAVCGCVVRDGAPIVAEHILETPDVRTDLVKSYGIKAYACYPLLGANGSIMGTLSFGTRSRGTFRADELSLMKAVADQVAVAILRRDGERSLQEALALLDAIFESSPVGLAFCDRDLRFVRVNRALAEMNGLSTEEHVGRTPAEVLPEVDDVQGIMSQWRQVMRTGQPVLGREVMGQTPASAGQTRFWLETWFPVRMDGNIIGIAATVLDITNRRNAEEELARSHARLEAMVRQRTAQLEDAVRALENEIVERKKMEEELKQSWERLQEISRRTVQALETDRQSMSRELHDSIGGNLAALKFILEESLELASENSPAAASLENAISFLSQTIKESKRIAAKMRPLTLDDLGIVTTLRGYIKQIAGQYKTIRIDSRIDIREEDVTEERKIMLYRILQEALTNAVKHGHAETVDIGLHIAEGFLVLEVKDDGVGFDPHALMSREDPLSGLGLKSMRERVEICRGTFSIESGAGRGTLLRAAFPA